MPSENDNMNIMSERVCDLEVRIVPTKYEKYIFFIDWDDTIICSTYLDILGLGLHTERELTEHEKKDLSSLEESALKFIKSIQNYGKLIIITNAQQNWVEKSSAKFFPRLSEEVSKMTVVSARDSYDQVTTDPMLWKYYTMDALLSMHLTVDKDHHVISIGDSLAEKLAVQKATKDKENVYTKIIKFIDRPSSETLSQQHELVCICLKGICDESKAMDVSITPIPFLDLSEPDKDIRKKLDDEIVKYSAYRKLEQCKKEIKELEIEELKDELFTDVRVEVNPYGIL